MKTKLPTLRTALQKMTNMRFAVLSTRRRQILAAAGISVLLIGLITVIEVVPIYSQCAAIIDARLAGNSLVHPPGIYAAPCRVSQGERIGSSELVERLLRAGYQESDQSYEFATGSFALQPELVELHTNEVVVSEKLPASVRVWFKENLITRIEDGDTGRQLTAVYLPAEMLTADLNAKKQTRRATNFDELPPILVKALTSTEDRHFFEHRGVHLGSIFRALYTNVVKGGIRQGGSTITQQLIKNQFLTPERTFRRKVTEAMMAIAIERRLTKEQIFALYCDRVYLGHSGITTIYGFKRAAMVFFGKELSDLSLSETACLAGLAQAPNRYSLYSHRDVALTRRDAVLKGMVDAGQISATEAESAMGEELALLPQRELDDTAAPYFIDYLKRDLSRLSIEEEEWPQLSIETTLDSDLQQAANQAVTRHLDRITKITSKHNHGAQPEAALIALNPHTGEILAMVGGRNYATSQLNRSTDAMRQPGSVFKPMVYAAALMRGISPATMFLNSRQEFEYGYKAVYRPENFGLSYSNQRVTLREAMVRSLNVVAVDAALQAGLGNVAEMAFRAGLPRPEIYPSMALGAFEATPMDVARAYTTFANEGVRVNPIAIQSVTANGEVLRTGAAPKAGVLPATLAYLVTDALSDVVNRGTAARIRSLGFRGPAAGKTGTSRDAWFVGYTPNLLVVVWVGNDDNTDLGLTGGEAAVPIWADFVTRALQLHPELAAERFAKPGGLEMVEIDSDNGMLANEFCPHRQRILVASSLLPGACFEHQAPVASLDNEEVNTEELTPVVVDIPDAGAEPAQTGPPEREEERPTPALVKSRRLFEPPALERQAGAWRSQAAQSAGSPRP
jgi:penicillin-binding protein 1B